MVNKMSEVDSRILVDASKIAYAVLDGQGYIRYMANDKIKCVDNVRARKWEGGTRIVPVNIEILREVITYMKADNVKKKG